MNITERRITLLKIIKEKQYVSINELSDMLQVSSMTIRRDLQLYENQGMIIISHGTISMNEDLNYEPSFQEKLGTKMGSKEKIAKIAAGYVKDGDVIILDCGTTVLQMMKYLQDKKITIVTNSYPVVQLVGANSKITLYMAPGKYSDVSAGFFGETTINYYHQLKADKVFMGTHGYDENRGASVPTLEDANTKKAILEAANKKYLLFEEGKKNTSCMALFASPEDFTEIISS